MSPDVRGFQRCVFPILGLVSGAPDCAYSLATCNATTALAVAALAAGLGGKTVLADRRAWVGSLGSLEFAGANLKLVDSFNDLENCHAAAILATDTEGKRHNVDNIREYCDSHDCLYVEDTGWLPGLTSPQGEYSRADVQVVSFGPGKPISLGEGGALLTRQKQLYDRALALSQHPERLAAEGFEVGTGLPPINARIHPLAAVIGVELFRVDSPGQPAEPL